MAGPLFAALNQRPVRDLLQCLGQLPLGLVDHGVPRPVLALEHAVDAYHVEHQDAFLEAGQSRVTVDGTVYDFHHAVDLNCHAVGESR